MGENLLKREKLKCLLDKVLNDIGLLRKGGEEAVYFCFACGHYKRKLEINLDSQKWACWVCHIRGNSIRSLFYKLKTKDAYFDELYKIIGKTWTVYEEKEEKQKDLSLPEEFIPLWIPQNSSTFGQAITYLQNRNITMDDILRYNIGYCESGPYAQRVLIPSYDKDANINFFAARTYHENNSYKYMLSPWPKDIIGFELFVNWNDPSGITIVEGTFDAIAVRNNVIPLFGTTLTFSLKLAIITNKVKRINIILDNDALKQAINIFDRIEDLQSNQIDIHLIRLEDKDPSVLGFKAINELIEKSKPYGFEDIIRAKLDI